MISAMGGGAQFVQAGDFEGSAECSLAKKAGITTRSLTLVAVYVISFLNEC